MPDPTPVVFISYSHDSDVQRERVLGLSERMRDDGIETRLDQYEKGTPPERWPRWILNKLDEATFVLVVCTETYYRRFRGSEVPGKGRGVDFEGAIITQEVYDTRSTTLKFVPVVFSRADREHIPEPLRGIDPFVLDITANYEKLCDFLFGVAGVEARPVGKLKKRERRKGTRISFGDEIKANLSIPNEILGPPPRDDQNTTFQAAKEQPLPSSPKPAPTIAPKPFEHRKTVGNPLAVNSNGIGEGTSPRAAKSPGSRSSKPFQVETKGKFSWQDFLLACGLALTLLALILLLLK